MGQLVIKLMGRFAVSKAGEPISRFETNKARALLAYLAAEPNHAHARESLAGMLWPDAPQSAATQNLRHTLPTLRNTIGDRQTQPPYLLITRETVQINLESELQVDLWEFERLLALPASSHPLSSISAENADALKAAIALVQGPFLDGLSCDSDIFDHWLQARREGINRQFREALRHLARSDIEAGTYEQAIRHARRLVELEPWDEAAHRLVMEGLARLGQRSDALAQYEICCQALGELNIEPETETQQMYEAIRSGQLRTTTVPISTTRKPLPANWPPLIGRERELEEIQSHLNDPACRLLTITGPGGIGKTHLAVEAAARQADRFKHGVTFVSLAPIQSAAAIPPAIAQALGFTFYPRGEPEQELLDYLRRKELLLLLDNFEHLPEGARLVTAILEAAPRVKILVTSRSRLRLLNEQLFPLEGLDFPQSQMRNLSEYSAVKLFIAGARRVQPRFAATENDWETIGQICQHVQGLPLAILLAAGWMEMLPPAEILREIERRSLDFLEAGWQDVPERQRSLRAVFAGSYRLLSPREQEIFAGLSVFRGGFTLASAQAVTGVTLSELRALVDKCLVQRVQPVQQVLPVQHDAEERYLLHELLRKYAEEALDRSPALRESTHDRHAAYFAAALAGWWRDLRGSRQFTAIQTLGVELENALAAWDWMVERIQVEPMRQAIFGLLRGLGWAYGEQMGIQTGIRLCQQAASQLAPLVLPAPTAAANGARLLAAIWINQPVLAYQIPDPALLQRSEILLNQLAASGQDIRLERAMLLRRMGKLSAEAGKAEASRKLYGESLELFRAVGELHWAALVLQDWGFSAMLFGRQSEGIQMLKESIAILQQLGDRISMSLSISNIRETLWQIDGEYEEHEGQLREYVAACQESGNTQLIANASGELGIFFLRQGKFPEAYAMLAESLASLDQLGAMAEWHFYSAFLCEAQISLGQSEQAYTRLQEILPYYRKTSQFVLVGFILLLSGMAALALGRYAEARQHLEEAVAVEPEPRINDRGMGIAYLAYAERGLGQPDRTISNLIQALNIGAKNRMVPVFYIALPAAALQLLDMGEIEPALEIYALASRFHYVANSRWWETVAGQEIAARAAGLLPEGVTAAQARGRARDLFATAEELMAKFQKISR